MKKLRLLLLVLASALACAQTHTFPALDTNNVFTGADTFADLAIPPVQFAHLPAPGFAGRLQPVSDGDIACTGGGGSTACLFMDTGGAWVAIAGTGAALPANICIANSQAGADLNTKINACNASLIAGGGSGEIWAYGGGVLQTCASPTSGPCTTAIVGPNVNLVMFPGHYTTAVCYGAGCPSYNSADVITLQSNSGLECRGDNWNVIIDEPQISTCASGGAPGSCGYPQGSWTVIGDYPGFHLNGAAVANVSIKGCHILGLAQYVNGGVTPSLGLGNVTGGLIQHNWLEHTHGLGMGFGGGSVSGNYANHVWMEDNLVTDSAHQSTYIINSSDWHIINNKLILTPGQTTQYSNVPVDVEPNVGDVMGMGEVSGNFIDWSNCQSGCDSHAIAIQEGNLLYNTPPIDYAPILISNNVIKGTSDVPNTNNYINAAFYINFSNNVTVTGNHVHGALNAVWSPGSDHLTVINNFFDEIHSGYEFNQTTNALIANNRVYCSQTAGWPPCSGHIDEADTSDYNVFAANLTYAAASTAGVNGGDFPTIVGAHSIIASNYDAFKHWWMTGTAYHGPDGSAAAPALGFNSEVYDGLGLYRAAAGKLGINGSPAIAGSLQTSALPTPTAPLIQQGGASGSTSNTYKIVYKDGLGNQTAASAATTITTSNATLTSSNYNVVRPVDGADSNHCPPGAASYDVYRTASGGTPSSTGKIGNLPCNDTSLLGGAPTYILYPQFKDTGLAGDSGSPPTVNTTGVIISTVAVGTAPLVVTSTTPVANLTTVPATHNHSGTQATGAHLVQDSCVLGTSCAVTLAGAAVFTSSTSYTCLCRDDTDGTKSCSVAQSSGSAVTFTGNGTDTLRYSCTGN